MKDTLIKGTGNSRSLKSAITAETTFEQFKEMLMAGTLPIDLGPIQAAGTDVIGTPLNTATLLTNETAVSLGLGSDDPTVNEAFASRRLLIGTTDPTTATVGALGQQYWNSISGKLFMCVSVSGNTYTWKQISLGVSYVKKLITDIITSSRTWTAPANIASDVTALIFGGGGGGGCRLTDDAYATYGGGGGGGHMAKGVFTIAGGQAVTCTIGAAGKGYKGSITTNDVVTVTQNPTNGGATSFGAFLTANGGACGSPNSSNSSGYNGGDGGTGGGGGAKQQSTYNSIGNGGNGTYGGGGGGNTGGNGGTYGGGGGGNIGGNGGTYGGGGGGGYNNTTASSGGTYGGAGGYRNSSGSNVSAKSGTNTVGMGLEYEGQGKAGSVGTTDSTSYAHLVGHGGGGGYGGNGGNGGEGIYQGRGGSGGGGGYGGNGGNGDRGSNSGGNTYGGGNGGGGGYGGNGGNGSSSYAGGGGGYGGNGGNGGIGGYGAGGGGGGGYGVGSDGGTCSSVEETRHGKGYASGGCGYGMRTYGNAQSGNGTPGIIILTYYALVAEAS